MKIESIGLRTMFLVPSIKVYNKKYSKSGQSVARLIHDFLTNSFGGYTCASGNIYGYFMSEFTEYDELREFRVAFDDPRRRVDPLDIESPCGKLREFLAKLADDIGEECIYLERGVDAFLIYP